MTIPPPPAPAGEGGRFQSGRSCSSADGHPETMKCHSERSEESCSASGIPPQKDQGEIPRFARNDSAFQSSMSEVRNVNFGTRRGDIMSDFEC